MKEWIGPLDNRKVHPGGWGKHFFKSPEWEAAFPWPLRRSGVLVYILTFIPSSSQKPTPLTEPFRKSVLWHNYTKNSAGALGAGLASAPAITGVCLSGTPASCTRALPHAPTLLLPCRYWIHGSQRDLLGCILLSHLTNYVPKLGPTIHSPDSVNKELSKFKTYFYKI